MSNYQIEHRCLVRPNGLAIGGFDKVNDEFADRVLAELNTLQAETDALRQRNEELEAELADHKHDIEVHENFQENIRKSIQPYAVKFYDGNGAKDGKTIYDHLGEYIGKLEKDALTITAFSLRDFHTGTLIDIPISGLIEHATKQNTRIKELEAELKEARSDAWSALAEVANNARNTDERKQKVIDEAYRCLMLDGDSKGAIEALKDEANNPYPAA